MEIDQNLIADVERLKTGGHVHWVNATLYRYKNGSAEAEKYLRAFVVNNGKFRKMTPQQLRDVWMRMKYPPENLPKAIEDLEKDPEWG